MTLYYDCPWCGKQDSADMWDLPSEYSCSWCSKDVLITVLKDEEEEEINDKHV